MTTIYRSNFSTLWVELWADEQLGLLDSAYIEDYNGVDGTVTLHHVPTSTDYQVVMSPYPGETPEVSNDVFKGTVTLASLPDGLFEVRGHARDTAGNSTVLGALAGGNPPGARVLSLQLTIASGSGSRIYTVPTRAAFRAGYAVTAARPVLSGAIQATRNRTVMYPDGRYQTEDA